MREFAFKNLHAYKNEFQKNWVRKNYNAEFCRKINTSLCESTIIIPTFTYLTPTYAYSINLKFADKLLCILVVKMAFRTTGATNCCLLPYVITSWYAPRWSVTWSSYCVTLMEEKIRKCDKIYIHMGN